MRRAQKRLRLSLRRLDAQDSLAVQDGTQMRRRTETLATLHHLRQQTEQPFMRPNLSLGDFIAPKATALPDYIGAFAVTTGHRCLRILR